MASTGRDEDAGKSRIKVRRGIGRPPSPSLVFLFLPTFAAALFSSAFFLLASLGVFYPPSPHNAPSSLRDLPWLRASSAGAFVSLCGNAGKAASGEPQFFLVAVIFNRVFGRDLFRILPFECRQWIEYMLYAGVEHIFWYDTAHSNAESQQAYLEPYTRAAILTYLRFHHIFPNSVRKGFHFEQDNSYDHFLHTFRNKTRWVIQVDIDEYPFSPVDQDNCFLQRFVREIEDANITQILLQSLTFAGNPRGDLVHGWVIERYQRRKYETEGVEKGYESRQKPLYRADLCKGVLKENPHVVRMEDGKTEVANEGRMRLNHYWGAREFGFAPDTLETTGMLVADSSIQSIASRIKQNTGLVKREEDTVGSFLRMLARG